MVMRFSKSMLEESITASGLDNSISFLHFISKGENSLTFDLMETLANQYRLFDSSSSRRDEEIKRAEIWFY